MVSDGPTMGDSGQGSDALQVPAVSPPNRADAAYDELTALREEAEGLGLDPDPKEPLAELRARVEKARQERDGGA